MSWRDLSESTLARVAPLAEGERAIKHLAHDLK